MNFTLLLIGSAFILLACFYFGLQFYFYQKWLVIPKWEFPQNFVPNTTISVLIPARNEASNIQSCLQSILDQDYPEELLEILVIDDHSEDDTADIVNSIPDPRIQLIQLGDFEFPSTLQSFKKAALEIAIQKARGQLIVTTDADCKAPRQWLRYIAGRFQSDFPKVIAAPVNFYGERNVLERFQSLDFIGMMEITGVGITTKTFRMGNGANLAYTKKVFEEVQGFKGINNIASGDDMLLIQKIAAKYPDQIAFLKQERATILTKAKPDLPSFLSQRIRWATKSSKYKEPRLTLILGVVFLFCLALPIVFLLGIFWQPIFLAIGLFMLIGKCLFDYLLLRAGARFFHREDLIRSFWQAQLLHTIYIIVIGFLGLTIKQYRWKGRTVQ